jgi:hypothetical protein
MAARKTAAKATARRAVRWNVEEAGIGVIITTMEETKVREIGDGKRESQAWGG